MFGLFKKRKETSNESEKSKNAEQNLKKKKLKTRDLRNKAELRKGKFSKNNKKEEIQARNKENNRRFEDSGKNVALKQNVDSKKQIVELKNKNIEKKKPEENNTPLTNFQLVMLNAKNDLSSNLVTEHSKFIKGMQKKLLEVTKLDGYLQVEFEKLYKMAYVINQSKKTPKWMQFYDLLFIGEGHAVIISKFNTSAGPLLSIEETMKSSLKLNSLTAIFFKLEFIINQMIKMYNEGKNRNYHFKDSVRNLKNLGLIETELYKKLLFIAEIRSKVGRAWNIAELKYNNPEGSVIRLKNKETEIKALISEVYVDIVEIYIKVQEPYLHKFFLLWKDNELAINNADSFYYI